MMDRQRVLDFIRSFGVDRGSDSLKAIEAEAVRDRVPVIRRETRELLRILLEMKKPEKILIINNWKSAQKVVYLECFDSLTL